MIQGPDTKPQTEHYPNPQVPEGDETQQTGLNPNFIAPEQESQDQIPDPNIPPKSPNPQTPIQENNLSNQVYINQTGEGESPQNPQERVKGVMSGEVKGLEDASKISEEIATLQEKI